jgi:hypothetical protein
MEGTAGISHSSKGEHCWRGFNSGNWRTRIDVRDFIINNVTSYTGDEKFLAGPSKRTRAVWEKLQPYFEKERKNGVLAVDAHTPSTVLAHKPGYIDQENEIIVGLQTDQPFKRAIFPYGGLRMVEAGLKVGYYLLKIPFDDLVGVASGATGNPAILVYSTRMAPTERPDIGYAMIFPSMTIVKVVAVQIVGLLLGTGAA